MIKFPMKDAPRDGRGVELLVKYDNGPEDNPLLEEKYAWTIGCNQFDKTGIDEWVFVGWDWTAKNFTQGKGTPIAWRYCGLNEVVDKSKLKDFDLTNIAIEETIKQTVLPWLRKDEKEWYEAKQRSLTREDYKVASACGDAEAQCARAATIIEDLINHVTKLEFQLKNAGIEIER